MNWSFACRFRAGLTVLLAALAIASLRAAAAPDDAGDAGPKREGNALVFPHHGVRWALPERAGWDWEGITSDESAPTGVLAGVRLPPSEDGTQPWMVNVRLIAFEPPAVSSPGMWLALGGPEEAVSQLVDSRAKEPLVLRDVTVGGAPAAGVQVQGVKGDSRMCCRLYWVFLPTRSHQWTCRIFGEPSDDEAERLFREALAGADYEDKTTWVLQPAQFPLVGASARPRGSGLGEERKVAGPGFEAVKPPELAQIPLDVSGPSDNICFTWEGRSESRQEGICIQLARSPVDPLKKREPEYERAFELLRENAWRSAGLGPDARKKSGDTIWKLKFGSLKGMGYEIHGNHYGAPVVEYGYILTEGQYVWYLLVQFTGVDAERKMTKVWNAVRKKLKLDV